MMPLVAPLCCTVPYESRTCVGRTFYNGHRPYESRAQMHPITTSRRRTSERPLTNEMAS